MRFLLALLTLTFLSITAPAQHPPVRLEPRPEVKLEPLADLPYKVSPEDISGGQLLKKVAPVYPKEAKKAKAEGSVEVYVIVNQQGRVLGADAVEGDPLLIPAAVKAALKWRWEPTRVRGEPVKVTGTITFNFKL